MNWSAIGATGVVVGAIAVVATPPQLASRFERTLVSRAAMTKDLLLAFGCAIMDLAPPDQLAEIWAEISERE